MVCRMAVTGVVALAVAVCCGPIGVAGAQDAPQAQPGAVSGVDSGSMSGSNATAPAAAFEFSGLSAIARQLSTDCRVKSPAFEGTSPLRGVRRAIRERRPIKVLAVGSSSTVGIGASSPVASYPVRLERDLEGFLKGLDVQMIARGISGEIAEDAAERMKLEVAEARPDLVVWQVGTNDAMARVEDDEFAEQLRQTLGWLKENRIDVVLIDPQYVEKLSKDEHYARIVEIITEVAREKRVLLVHRYHAMQDLSRERPNKDFLAGDLFHLNDLGYRCMAEYAARAIVGGILSAEQEPVR